VPTGLSTRILAVDIYHWKIRKQLFGQTPKTNQRPYFPTPLPWFNPYQIHRVLREFIQILKMPFSI
jgi:hypothetical protein